MAGVVNTCPTCKQQVWDGDSLTCKCSKTNSASHCSPGCDVIHGGAFACLESAIKFVNDVGCIGYARHVLDVLEQSQALMDGRPNVGKAKNRTQ